MTFNDDRSAPTSPDVSPTGGRLREISLAELRAAATPGTSGASLSESQALLFSALGLEAPEFEAALLV